jgi:hypothetical protein
MKKGIETEEMAIEAMIAKAVENPGELAAPNRKRSRKKALHLNATACKYDIVKTCAKRVGFKLVEDMKNWSIFWIDTGVSVERILEM